jgi:ring-1,2-phenylacetyl-CoA epoxidase subunit PaaE
MAIDATYGLINATLVEVHELPNYCKQFVLQPNEPIAYLPGQFITIHHPDQKNRRVFSISSPPGQSTFTLTIKRIENGIVSRWLHDELKIGDKLKLSHPNGKFVYEPQQLTPRHIVLIAAGSGIAPFMSMIPEALKHEPQSNITLIYSNHSQQHTLYYDDLSDWENQFLNQFRVVHMWSNSKNLMRARLNPTVLADILNASLKQSKKDTLFYLCGPVDFMLMIRLSLLGFGYELNQIKRETFYIPPPEGDDDGEEEQSPLQNQAYDVTIIKNDIPTIIRINPGTFILDAAIEKGLAIQYSCKSGMCSTCIAQCESGSVAMDYNEVLTREEINKGRVLLCQAFPMSDNVVIKVQ